MTTVRIGVALIVLGIALFVGGVIPAVVDVANQDLLHISGVGSIVFGAVAVCIATETNGG